MSWLSRVGKRTVRSLGLRSDLRAVEHAAAQAARRVAARRTHPSLAEVRGTDLILNLGCGALAHPGCINADLAPPPGGYFADLRDPLPLADGCAAHIHCEHFLDQLEYPAARRFLAECRRVLRPGGSLRLIGADAGRYLEAYARGDRAFFARLRDLGNPSELFRTPMEVINQMFRMAGSHRFVWDLETLELALGEAGFARIERSQQGAAPPPYDLDGKDWWRGAESFYVDASNPRARLR